MFTGLIEEVGNVIEVRNRDGDLHLQVAAPRLAEEIQIGGSVAVNGCCLTVVSRRDNQLTFDLLQETLNRTNLGNLHPASRVNLERPLAVGGCFGGHFVQGHVDCTTRVISSKENGRDLRLEVELPGEFARYVARKGSIALNGISLTIADVSQGSFTVWIIPHTRAQTNLDTVRINDLVNLEFDLIAKYIERMLDRNAVRSN